MYPGYGGGSVGYKIQLNDKEVKRGRIQVFLIPVWKLEVPRVEMLSQQSDCLASHLKALSLGIRRASVTHEKANSVILEWMGGKDESTQIRPNLGRCRSTPGEYP